MCEARKARRGHQVPWAVNHHVEAGSSARAADALVCLFVQTGSHYTALAGLETATHQAGLRPPDLLPQASESKLFSFNSLGRMTH